MKPKNINCNGSEEKTKSYLNLIFFFCMVLTAEALYAQSNSDSNTVKVVVAKQEENLNVFQQWITLKLPRFGNQRTRSNS